MIAGRIVKKPELMFSDLKTLLRKAGERTMEAIQKRIGFRLNRFIADKCSSYLVDSAYPSA